MNTTYETRLLGDVLRLEYGKPLPKADRSPNGKYPAYGANGILCRTDKVYREYQSIVVGRKGSAGEVNLTEGAFWPTDVTYFVEHDNDTELRYIFHLLKYLELPKLAKGVKPGINRNDVYEIEVPIPLLPEQKLIVAILDEAFASIDQAKANTERNLANSRELFDSYLNRVFEEKGEGWERVTLPECSTNLDKSRKPITKSKREPGSIPYYGASGVVDHVKDHIFDEDLLLISEDGANLLARTYPIAFSISGKTWVNNHAHVLRFDDERTRRFVEFYLNSISLEPWVSGMAQPKLNQTKLNSIPIPQPTLDEQGHIVELLENVSSSAKELKLKGKEKLASLGLLKQSILKKAFAGELTSNPDKVLNEVGV